MNVLVVDIGGTNVKVHAGKQSWKIPSGRKMNAAKMVRDVRRLVSPEAYEAVAIGYPGMVVHGRPAAEPANLGEGWVRFPYQRAFGRPVRMLNDATLQALGSYQRGRMLFLGIGTGLGSAMIGNGVIQSMELAHLPYKKNRTYEDYVGKRGRERLGDKKWRKAVLDVINRLRAALGPDNVVLGGGNAEDVGELPEGVTLGDNRNAFVGGVRLWDDRWVVAPKPTRKPILPLSIA